MAKDPPASALEAQLLSPRLQPPRNSRRKTRLKSGKSKMVASKRKQDKENQDSVEPVIEQMRYLQAVISRIFGVSILYACLFISYTFRQDTSYFSMVYEDSWAHGLKPHYWQVCLYSQYLLDLNLLNHVGAPVVGPLLLFQWSWWWCFM